MRLQSTWESKTGRRVGYQIGSVNRLLAEDAVERSIGVQAHTACVCVLSLRWSLPGGELSFSRRKAIR